MKKVTLLLSALLIAGASFAHDGKGSCCKKETKACCKKEGKACCHNHSTAKNDKATSATAKKS
ncbi:MAG TPA: hypothetical protein VN721_00175 [Flavipsychrobacter sp.]|nr:hypothetical protein [Flavipsychrobacter sp.]